MQTMDDIAPELRPPLKRALRAPFTFFFSLVLGIFIMLLCAGMSAMGESTVISTLPGLFSHYPWPRMIGLVLVLALCYAPLGYSRWRKAWQLQQRLQDGTRLLNSSTPFPVEVRCWKAYDRTEKAFIWLAGLRPCGADPQTSFTPYRIIVPEKIVQDADSPTPSFLFAADTMPEMQVIRTAGYPTLVIGKEEYVPPPFLHSLPAAEENPVLPPPPRAIPWLIDWQIRTHHCRIPMFLGMAFAIASLMPRCWHKFTGVLVPFSAEFYFGSVYLLGFTLFAALLLWMAIAGVPYCHRLRQLLRLGIPGWAMVEEVRRLSGGRKVLRLRIRDVSGAQYHQEITTAEHTLVRPPLYHWPQTGEFAVLFDPTGTLPPARWEVFSGVKFFSLLAIDTDGRMRIEPSSLFISLFCLSVVIACIIVIASYFNGTQGELLKLLR